MSRLATSVPRRRRLGRPRPAPIPLSPTHADFEPAGFYGVGETQGPRQTIAEKLAPGPKATQAATHTPPPSHSGGTSGDLTVPHYEPATPTGAPYVPSEPGHSAADFAKAVAAKRRRELLGTLAPLSPPTAPGFTHQPTPSVPSLLTHMDQLNTLEQLTALDPGDHAAVEGRALLSKLPAAAPAPVHSPQAPPTATPVAERSYRLATPKGVVQIPAQAVRANPQDPLGKATLGNTPLHQLLTAAQKGTLRVSKQGVITTPQNRQVLAQLQQAHQHFLATHSLEGPLTPGQIQFAEALSHDTGGILKPRTVATQALQEESGAAAQQREAEHNFDALNIGYTDSGPLPLTHGSVWGNPQTAAKATAEFLRGERYGAGAGIPQILEKAKGKSVAEQLQIIGESGWATSSYASNLAATSKLITEGHDPQAAVQLQVAKQNARRHGVNPTPWNGDVEGGDNQYVYVRADAKGAVDWARSTVGTQEGTPRQLHWAELEHLGPSEPWCSDWVSVNLARRGVTLPANPNYSGDYADPSWKGGTQLGTDISKAKPGDLIVYGADEHIAMYVGDGKVIAGNYGDEVAEYGATEDPRGISAIVRPHYKGGKVKIKAGQLPGSSTESTFGAAGGAGGEVVGGEGAAAPGEARPVSAPAGGAQAAAALANFAVPTAPGFAATVATPEINGEQTAAQELLALLTRPASGVNRA